MNRLQRRRPAVYGLRAHGEYGYVGRTGQNITTRLWEHRSRARSGHTAPVYQWMRMAGIDAVEIVELATDGDLEQAEIEWTMRLRTEGHVLFNQVGIDGTGKSMTVRSRQKISAARRGKATWIKGLHGEAAGWTPERRARQSELARARAAAARAGTTTS